MLTKQSSKQGENVSQQRRGRGQRELEECEQRRKQGRGVDWSLEKEVDPKKKGRRGKFSSGFNPWGAWERGTDPMERYFQKALGLPYPTGL